MRHAAKLETSERLQKFFNLLLDGKKHSTRDVGIMTDIEAAGSSKSEINDKVNQEYRENCGVDRIECKKMDGRFYYWVIWLMGKGESDGTGERRMETSEACHKKYAPDSPAPPNLSQQALSRTRNDWSHIQKEEEKQGVLFECYKLKFRLR